MMHLGMKKAAGVAAPAARKNGSSFTCDRNRRHIVSTILRMFAVVLLVLAFGHVQREDFVMGYGLALLAGLLLAATSDELARYFHYLHWLNRTQLAELRGLRPRGEHVGDGVPRTLAGKPFEPLSSWDGVRRS